MSSPNISNGISSLLLVSLIAESQFLTENSSTFLSLQVQICIPQLCATMKLRQVGIPSE